MSGIEILVIGGVIWYFADKHHKAKRAKRAALEAAINEGRILQDINGNIVHLTPPTSNSEKQQQVGEDGLPFYSAAVREAKPPKYVAGSGQHGVPMVVQPGSEIEQRLQADGWERGPALPGYVEATGSKGKNDHVKGERRRKFIERVRFGPKAAAPMPVDEAEGRA